MGIGGPLGPQGGPDRGKMGPHGPPWPLGPFRIRIRKIGPDPGTPGNNFLHFDPETDSFGPGDSSGWLRGGILLRIGSLGPPKSGLGPTTSDRVPDTWYQVPADKSDQSGGGDKSDQSGATRAISLGRQERSVWGDKSDRSVATVWPGRR